MAENSLKAQKPRITQKQQKSRLRRFYFLLLTAVLFAAGAQAGELFHVEERLYDAAGEEDIRETLAAGGDKKETKTKVYASGEPVGVYIKTRGVLVLGIQNVKTADNRTCSPAERKLESGDYILAMNGEDISSKAQFISCLQKNEEKEAVLTISRNGEEQQIKIQPVYSEEDHCYQIGAWIRNDTQGIGTVTYITEDGNFAALGHGISDCDLGVQLNIAGGSIYETDIASIMKGKAKDPGQVIGTIDYIPEKYLGNIGINSTCGIFGLIKNHQENFRNGQLMEVADASEIKTGKAFVRTSISGESRDYTIEIEKISLSKKDAQKALRIKITDPDLIALTGGIIQGESGSPIIQDGKLIGAVTHVFVDDPTRGYGICAETMMEEAGER
ncbi:MAG TPA: SpoIVB peptidase [Candidatus Anaerobutyricum faecale]|nr:SpoIVB peptidase [Candidatus Anaerobutyricum faecale]